MTTQELKQQARKEFVYLFGYEISEVQKEYPKYLSHDPDICKFMDSLIDRTIQATEERIVEKCQKEMYKSLEEVCQYKINGQQMFVNKNDVKVWIKSLEN